jgi:peptidoglycan hydrolase-like protein with peptidoglycan-binding domain
MDIWVQNSQHWLNTHYSGTPGYVSVPEDGLTGWHTMYAATRALQIALGITSVSDNFGPTTFAQLTSQVGSVSTSTDSDILAIFQCGMWCKGYNGGGNFGEWSTDLANAIYNMQIDMGFTDPLVFAPPKVFKSLLTMDAYVLPFGGSVGDSGIRQAQQWLNNKYSGRRDFYILPCDGIFSRNVQNGLMYAIQYELGMADGVATGNFGPGTQSGLRTSAVKSLGNSDVPAGNSFIHLFQAALRFNGYSSPFSGSFDQNTQSVTITFQSFAQLPATGTSSYSTWASLLVSTGDPSRPGAAFDTNVSLTATAAASVYTAGYRTAGRYLTVDGKKYGPGELDTIFNAGLSTFPIFQNFNNGPQYFSQTIAKDQAHQAIQRARQLGFKAGAVIYFAVDYDATDDEIQSLIKPFFTWIQGEFAQSSIHYQLGVYGTRNVCQQLHTAGLTTSSFVSGMSTGYSGNLGFPLPDNWHYDQIQNLSAAASGLPIEIDKDVKSSSAPVVTTAGVSITPVLTSGSTRTFDPFYWWFVQSAYTVDRIIGVPDLFVTTADVNNGILMGIMNQNPSYTQQEAFAYYTPVPGSIGYAADAINASAPTIPTGTPYPGKIDHWAATTRGYLYWGAPTSNTDVQISDLAGWALDLNSLWQDYEIARLGGYSSGVGPYFATYLGGSNGRFTFDQLIADVDAYNLIALYPAQTPLEIGLGDYLQRCYNDPTYRWHQFIIHRCLNSLTTAAQLAISLYTSTNPGIVGSILFKDQAFGFPRHPGQTKNSATDPTAGVIATELADVGSAFALKLQQLAGL